jgi:potassium channel subfamily K
LYLTTTGTSSMVLFGGLWTTRAHHHEQDDYLHNNHNHDDHDHEHNNDNDNERQAQMTQYGTVLQEEEQDIPSLTSNFTDVETVEVLKLCAMYTSVYVFAGTIAFSFVFEKWTIIDSIYFSVSLFTTCGYGDLQPTSEAGQIFTIFFAVYGVLILGIFIGIVGHAISEGQTKARKAMRKENQTEILQTLFTDSEREIGGSRRGREDERDALLRHRFLNDQKTLMDDIKQVVRAEFPEIMVVGLAGYILGVREGWSFTSTMYFCIMSATTTGFGDYAPKSQADKLYCIFFLPFAVAVFGEVVGRIASVYIRRKTRKAERKFLKRSLTMCDIRKMDANSDGVVDFEEFLIFMLVALGKVDKTSIDELRTIFKSLDANGSGMLEREDLLDRLQ